MNPLVQLINRVASFENTNNLIKAQVVMAVVQVRESNKGFPLLILTAACGGGIVP